MAHADDSVTRRDSDQTRVHPGGDASGDSSSGHGPPLAGFDARWADIGTTLGRYVLVERVGAGGMGTVVRAYDPKLHREVALKRVRRKAIGAEATERMMREAQAMAQLSHPNVVAVHDVEVIDDAVVIAMEYVAGTTLDRWCEQPGRSWRAVLDAYLQAAQGLLAAHRAHLVHRDFKPSNVLVGEDERVKVMDFGLAKPEADAPPSESAMLAILAHGSADSDLDRTLTRADTVVGTPKYMAPEQHTGATADARADQYAFCLALWEALCGTPPFALRDIDGLAAAKLRGPPPWPGVRGIPARVGEILRRGLAPDPRERFVDIAALTKALGDAARPRPLGRIAVAAVLGGGALVAAALLGRGRPCAEAGAGVAASWNDDVRADIARSLGADHPDAAARVEALVDAWVERWTATAAEACEATHVRHEQSPALLDLRTACLDRRRSELDAALEQLGTDPGVAVAAVDLVLALPPIDGCNDLDALQAEVPPPGPELRAAVDRGRHELARAASQLAAGHFDESLALARQVAQDQAAADYPPLHLEAELACAEALSRLGRAPEAARRLEIVVSGALERGLQAVAVDAAIARTHVVGVVLMRPIEGLVHAELALALARHRDPEGVLEARARLAHGGVLGVSARYGEAEAEVRQSLALIERLRGADDVEAARGRSQLGLLLWQQGRFAEAEAEHRQVHAIRERVLGPEHPETLAASEGIGTALLSQGRAGDAAAVHRGVLAVRTRVLGADHPSTALTRANLARALGAQGLDVESQRELEAAFESLRRVQGPDHPMTIGTQLNLGIAIMARGDNAAARELFADAAERFTRVLGDQHPYTAAALFNLAKATERLGDAPSAEREYKRARAVMLATLPAEHRDLASVRINLANALEEQGKLDEAEAELRKAVVALAEGLGPRHLDTGGARNNLAGVLEAQGKLDEAEAEYRAALEIIEPTMDPRNANLAIAYYDLGELLVRRNRLAEALPLLEHAVELLRDAQLRDVERGEIYFGLARALADQPDQRARARELATQAERLLAGGGAAVVDEHDEVLRWLHDHGR